MAITKIWITEGCTGCGLCGDTCPEVFKVDSEASVIAGVNYSGYESKIRDAAESCPVEVIKYTE
jgi:ferredoxin